MIQSFDTSRGSIAIREASRADATQFRELRLGALQDSPIAFSADYHINAGHPMGFWEGRLEKDGNGIILLAEYDRRFIGMTGIRRGESAKTKHSAGIWGVYIRPEWRGLRIAEALLETCIDWARMRGVVIVKLAVVSANESAIRCYERCGFKIYGIEPRAILYEDQYYNEYLMFRDLSA